ncbi:diguanylate cyclase domain-containing protein [Glaciecola sp. 1036]|uniref:diguanylate cyclase domain-containing protein n=1 Tax=Alteromonadaceae TaxID=72275 RepID=UPI003D073C3F
MGIQKSSYEKQINESFAELEQQSVQLVTEKLLQRLCLFGAFSHLFFIFFFALIGSHELAFLNVISVTLWVIATIQNMRQHHTWCIRLIIIEVVLHSYIVTYMIGIAYGFHFYLWSLIGFVLSGPIGTLKQQIKIILVIIVGFIGIYFMSLSNNYALDVTSLAPYAYSVNLFLSIIPIAIVVYHSRKNSAQSAKSFFIQANTDIVTGTFNRLYVEKLLKEAQEGLTRRGFDQYSVVLCSIQNLHELKETEQNANVDKVLQNVAKTIQSNIRDSDLVARWQFDEFMILLSNATHETTLKIVDKIKSAIEQVKVLKDDNSDIVLGAAFGIADSAGTDDFDRVIIKANVNLIQAKAKFVTKD